MTSAQGFYLGPTPIQAIEDPYLTGKGVGVFIKREDLLHEGLSGNKWHKLKFNIAAALKEKQSLSSEALESEAIDAEVIPTLLSFGGAYSNHLHALSVAGKLYGYPTIGLVRGEELETKCLNQTLQQAQGNGMQLKFLSRSDYRLKTRPDFIARLKDELGDFYLIPEGGSNLEGARGCSGFMMETLAQADEMGHDFNHIVMACGTGTTLAGAVHALAVSNWQSRPFGKNELIRKGLKGNDSVGRQLKGVLAVNDKENIANRVSNLVAELFDVAQTDGLQKPLKNASFYTLDDRYHCGGFAKLSKDLVDFIDRFHQRVGIALDPVYTGKVMHAIYQSVEKDEYVAGDSVLMVHSGGLQGAYGLLNKMDQLRNRR